ncbi:ATP-binding protein [Promicromonospora kroppenstedtii]|uniref:ATP-binding protein n=1 Tax=Promicromonospora kroppenstedtii TaxID=440482 RepID=A0ABW7XHN1_9MICO
MALTTSLNGRVRNTSLPKSHALLPVLEAVVNSIQAIDARFGENVEQGRLSVRIRRSAQGELDLGQIGPGRVPMKPIVGFDIEDNGVGFTPENMVSFETLDSEHKAAMGCRGVGRLLWLKAFERVTVSSAYKEDDGILRGRQFRFSIDREVEPDQEPSDVSDAGTLVSLDGFKKPFQRSAPKSVEPIAREILEHCIWYFLRAGGAPRVTVIDDEDAETVSLEKLMDEILLSKMDTTTVSIKGQQFNMVSLRLKPSTRNAIPRLYWCAANRVVVEENLTGKIPGLNGRLKDADATEFAYACYVSSGYLNTNVRADRTAFDLPERTLDTAAVEDLSLDEIRAGVLDEVEKLLDGPLKAAREEGKARVNDFVARRAPRYRPVLARLEELGVTVDPSVKDQELELLLHRNLQKLEAGAIQEGQALLAEDGFARPEDYDERLSRYLETVTEINQSDLAGYVARRRTILDALSRTIRLDEQGKYSREDKVHELLFPMRKDSNEVGSDASNLWIIDERLAFHDYLASDKPLKTMPITDSDSATEPDILLTRIAPGPVLAAEGDRVPLASIVVVELKRPMRNDVSEDKDPIQQSLNYVKRVRAGGIKTASGRQIPASPQPPAFCYIVADLTSTMIERCENANLRPMHDGTGYFGFNDAAKAYIEVISFDRLVSDAFQRNRAFFDKLGLPSS